MANQDDVQVIYPKNIYQGVRYSFQFQFPDDVSGGEFFSQVRRYPSTPDVAAEFNFDTTQSGDGIVKAFLTAAQTTVMQPGPYSWDFDWYEIAGDPESNRTVCRAEILVEAEVTR